MARQKTTVKFNKEQLATIQAYADAVAKQEYYSSIGENELADDLYFDIQTGERQLANEIVRLLGIKGRIG